MKSRNIRIKAASAAFAFAALSMAGSASAFSLPRLFSFDCPFPQLSDVPTLPALPDEEKAFRDIEFAVHWQQADALLLMKDFLSRYPVSSYSPYVQLMMADWYFFNGEYALAMQSYSSLRDGAFSGDIREGMLYRKGYALLKNGFYREARSLFRQVSPSGGFGEASKFYLAYIDYVEGKYDQAYKAFSEIRKSGRGGAEAEYYLNQMDYLKGEYRKVASTSDRLLKNDIPLELLAETMRVGGLSHFKIGETQQARSLLSDYADLTGDGAEYSALYALATIYYDEGDYARALPLFTTVTEFDGALAQSAWLYIGQILTRNGDQQGAALAFEKAGKQGWDTGVAETAFYNFAVSNVSGSALPFADSALAMESFLETYPDSPYASGLANYLANSYYNLHDYEAALRQIDKISTPDAETLAMRQKILYQLGVEQLQKGNVAAAMKNLADASAPAAPDKAVAAQAALWLGEANYLNKDYKAAVKAYESAISSGKLGANASLANYNLGYADMKLHDYGKAAAAFKKAIDSKGLSARQLTDARLRYADCLYYTGANAEALAIFRDVKLNGGQDGVYARMREADLLGRQGKTADKVAILEDIVDHEDAGIWRNAIISRLADTYTEMGQDRKAADMYGRMIDYASDGTDATRTYYALATNAENLFKRGDMDAAFEAYKRIEKSGIADLYPSALLGIARTSSSPEEVAEYAALAASTPGLTADEMNEVIFLGAKAGIELGDARKTEGMAALGNLADSSDRFWGARAAVLLGETLLEEGSLEQAESVLASLIDAGSSDNYWLARGYVALSDVYAAQGKDYLAKLYIESLRDNYPGKGDDIVEMINARLNSKSPSNKKK